MEQTERRRAKHMMSVAIHQSTQGEKDEQTQAETIDNIKETQKKKREVVRKISQDMRMQKESL